MQNGFSEEIRAQEKLLIQEFILREQQEEVFSKQKSRFKCLQEGERNTRFFHKASIQHRHGNQMGRMKKEDGTIAETQEDLEHTLNTFFTNILEEPDWDRVEDQREVMRHIPKVITEEHNFMLMKLIEMEEVEAVIKQMADDKALGPDGFITNFFHACWN